MTQYVDRNGEPWTNEKHLAMLRAQTAAETKQTTPDPPWYGNGIDQELLAFVVWVRERYVLSTDEILERIEKPWQYQNEVDEYEREREYERQIDRATEMMFDI